MEITLQEYQPALIPLDVLPLPLGEKLWRDFDTAGGRLSVEFPSPRTENQWRVTAQGWIGTIWLAPDLRLRIQPRVPIANLQQMWSYAYRLQDADFLPGLDHVTLLDGFYDQLALILARGVLRRARRGLQRMYVPHAGTLPYVKGQMDLRTLAKRPHDPALFCRYETHTADTLDNQILVSALDQIARGGYCAPDVQQVVRRALRALQPVATVRSLTSAACQEAVYTRLNEDYRPLHALCCFFLEHSSPGIAAGEAVSRPFLMNMPRLFERFVAEWLRVHLPDQWQLKTQQHVRLGERGTLAFMVDLVIYDPQKKPRLILDTKYKIGPKAETGDVSQLIAYAKAVGCNKAALVYPAPLADALDLYLDDLHVRALYFELGNDLEAAGQFLLQTFGLSTLTVETRRDG